MSITTTADGPATIEQACPRTALTLGSFYRELIGEEIPQNLAYEVVRAAARSLTHHVGICVKAAATESARPRTALGLGSFYRELIEEGIPEDLAYEVVRDAARPITERDGICVKASTQEVEA